MSRVIVMSLLAVIVAGTGPHIPVAAQAARSRVPLRTIDGHPNLQGYWTNDTFTPLERAPELGTKEFFTKAEAEAEFKRRQGRYLAQPKDDIHYDDAIWQEENYEKEINLRTSLIFDPPNGRIPPLTAEAARRVAARREAQKQSPVGGAQSRSLAERCISWGNVGPPMLPPTYNANLQILQTRGYVIVLHEMIHDVRFVRLDGSAHLPPGIRKLAGDSVGRWEGDTLVVDTTNFTDKTNFRGAPRSTRQDIFASDGLHVIERFTRVGSNQIRYQFTVDDPATWTSRWSGEVPLRRFDGPLFEYACHEGNYGLPNILAGALGEPGRRAPPAGEK